MQEHISQIMEVNDDLVKQFASIQSKIATLQMHQTKLREATMEEKVKSSQSELTKQTSVMLDCNKTESTSLCQEIQKQLEVVCRSPKMQSKNLRSRMVLGKVN